MALTLGEQLRKLREERNLTLQQVAKGTHIRLEYLQALESDDRELLPSPVQGKGFVRVVAGFLNAPVEPLLDLWEGKNPEETLQTAKEPDFEDSPVEVKPVTEEPAPEPKAEPEPVSIKAPQDIIEAEVEADLQAEPEPLLSEELAPSEAADIFEQIGVELRQQRETVSLSLDDVERFTKVRKHYLQALEEGRFDDLPSPVQGRGMLSNYSNFLNLDTEALLLQFADALQIRRLEQQPPAAGRRAVQSTAPEKQPQVRTASPAKLAWRRLVTPDLLVGGVLLLSMLGFIIWGAARVSRLSAEASVITPPSISEILQITATASSTPETQEPSTAVTQAATAEIGGVEAPTLETGEITDPVDATPALPQGEVGAVQIHVIVNQRAFLRITVDGETAFNGRVAPGSAYTFSADEQLELLTGNAAALQVFFQQQDLGTLGLIGQVASLVFTAEGIITPTPQPTSTGQPTATPTPTMAATSDQPAPTITPYIP